MYDILAYVSKPDNAPRVAEIVRPILEGDILNDEIARQNLERLKQLKSIGEEKVYGQVLERMLNHPVYKALI